jgi:putative heme-binding domain-containing protein
LPDALVAAIAKSGGLSLALRLRQGDATAVDEAMQLLTDDKAKEKARLQVVQILGQVNQPRCVPPLLKLVSGAKDTALRTAALTALQAYDSPEIGAELVAMQKKLPGDVWNVGQTVLASRKTWAIALLEAVDAKQVDRNSVTPATVRKMLLFPDDKIAALVKKSWGDVQGATSAEMRAQVERFAALIETGSGNPYSGRSLYRESCGKCHQLFQDGGKIGPDLTSFKRDDLKRMLLNVVNPSAEIREGFENYLIVTADGRALNGFIADQDKQVVSLRSVAGQTLVIPRDDIEEIRVVNVSLMPEGLLKDLSEQQVRDLFAYLRSTQPLP